MKKIRTFREGDRARLLAWFRAHQRPLPWRKNRDPYRVWLSETMLQQTTTTAVIPYFEKFLTAFPTLKSLANAEESEVLRNWAGLGYYSRARNILRAAQMLNERGGFPKTAAELLEFPGFGPYTARAVASIAFGEAVGVLDGNVIRVLSRYHGWKSEWWKTPVRQEMQYLADSWVDGQPSHEINQSLMELGAVVCSPQKPTCALCPLRGGCFALANHQQLELPLPRPKREKEIWHWELTLPMKRGELALELNANLPFLKGHWIPPGTAKRLVKKPKEFSFKHTITHHEIYVNIVPKRISGRGEKNWRWVKFQDIESVAPTSVLKKAMRFCETI